MNSYVLFHSSNYAIWAENILRDADICYKLVSVPREVSSDCGYCIKVSKDMKERVVQLLKEKHVVIEKVVDL